MYKTFVWVYFFFICIGGAIAGVDAFCDSAGLCSLIDPFTNSTITPADLPNLGNITVGQQDDNSVLGNITNPRNSSDSNPYSITAETDINIISWETAWYIIRLFTGNFIFEAITMFGFPIYAVQYMIIPPILFMIIVAVSFYIHSKG